MNWNELSVNLRKGEKEALSNILIRKNKNKLSLLL